MSFVTELVTPLRRGNGDVREDRNEKKMENPGCDNRCGTASRW
jgi:hypothetical protein